MTKIFFSNKQFAKLKELVYLGERVKNAFYIQSQKEYDAETNELSEYIDSFAKDHDMKKFLNKNNRFTSHFDDLMRPIIDRYDSNTMFEKLAQLCAERDFFHDHQREPIFDLQNPERDEYEKLMKYKDTYLTEFENHGLTRLFIRSE